MTVNGTEIAKVERFKQVAAFAHHAFDARFQLGSHITRKSFTYGQFAQQVPYVVTDLIVSIRSGNISQVFLQRTYVGIYAHAIIIQDDEHIRICHSSMVHGFEGHTRCHGTITDHRHRFAVGFAFDPGGHGHSQCCGNRGGGMPNTKCIILAFASFGKTAKAFVFTVGNKIIPATCEDLMPVSLVTDIPYKLVVRGIIDIMQRYRKLHHTQAGREMAAVHTYHVNDELP